MDTPDHKPVVSILMAVYNAERFLAKSIDSVLCQTFTSWELICVDDASTDSSLSILWKYAAKDSRIQVLHKDVNAGQAVARNDALKMVRGDYVTMLDADDWLSEDCLEKALMVMDSETDCAVLRLMQCYEDEASAKHKATKTCGGSESVGGDDAFRMELYEVPFADYSTITGNDAFLASLDWQLHGLYLVRADLHKRYPYDTTCHLFSDDNTTRLHYLHSRQVRFCSGTYFYRKHEESCTNALTADRFLLMQANLSMRDTLLAEGVSEDVLQTYERHRWLNYIGQIWLYVQHRHQLSSPERRQIRARFKLIYRTFTSRPVPAKFGYTHFRSYTLFCLQEAAYFTLRKLFCRTLK